MEESGEVRDAIVNKDDENPVSYTHLWGGVSRSLEASGFFL